MSTNSNCSRWTLAQNGTSILVDGVRIDQKVGPSAQSAEVQRSIEEAAKKRARLLVRSPDLLDMVKRLVVVGSPCMDGHQYPLSQRILLEAAELIDSIEGNVSASGAN